MIDQVENGLMVREVFSGRSGVSLPTAVRVGNPVLISVLLDDSSFLESPTFLPTVYFVHYIYN